MVLLLLEVMSVGATYFNAVACFFLCGNTSGNNGSAQQCTDKGTCYLPAALHYSISYTAVAQPHGRVCRCPVFYRCAPTLQI